MALLENQLFVKRSTIAGAGKGLFTKKMIPKGTRIVEYKGKITSWEDADHLDGQNYYLFYVNKDHVIDARKYMNSLARYCNDANGFIKAKSKRNNSKYVLDGLKAFVEATRDIAAGEEILVAYGKKYWDVAQKNIQLKDKKEKIRA